MLLPLHYSATCYSASCCLGRLFVVLPVILLVVIVQGNSCQSLSVVDRSGTPWSSLSYSQARFIRTLHGHEAAKPFYQQLLCRHPEDKTAASYIAASSSTPERHDNTCRRLDKIKIQQLRSILDAHNYTNAAVQNVLQVPERLQYASAPVFVTPLSAGTHNFHLIPQNGLETLMALFLLGTTQPKQLVESQLGDSFLPLLHDLGLAFVEHNLSQPALVHNHDGNNNHQPPNGGAVVVPYVHLCPLSLRPSFARGHHDAHDSIKDEEDVVLEENLILVTDLHPRILSSTTVGTNQDPTVMYIGPDSLALVQHYTNHFARNNTSNKSNMTSMLDTVLDVCTGSGIQALSVKCRHAVCMDLNSRALAFVQFNAVLNGRDNVYCILGDLLQTNQSQWHRWDHGHSEYHPKDFRGQKGNDVNPIQSILQENSVDLLLANPPFIPVPPSDDDDAGIVSQRYGLFSSGGPDGEDVLRAILRLASRVLKADGGTLAIVTEFMNPQEILSSNNCGSGSSSNTNNKSSFLTSFGRDCETSQSMSIVGLLCTNEIPVPGNTYAARRADSQEEFHVWSQHLERMGIQDISPGLLYMQKRLVNDEQQTLGMDGDHDCGRIHLRQCLVPKTEFGSIWTPSNQHAVEYTRRAWSIALNSL